MTTWSRWLARSSRPQSITSGWHIPRCATRPRRTTWNFQSRRPSTSHAISNQSASTAREAAMIEALYIVISLKHTHRRDKAVTLWRPDDRGYCWRLEWAGRYPEQQVLDHLGYYNSGCSNIAVPAELVERLSCEVEYGDGERAICLPNNRDT